MRAAGGNHAAARVVAAHLARAPAAPAEASAETGLGADESVERLAGAGGELAAEWAALATPKKRANLLFRAARAELRRLDVPPFELALEAPPGTAPLDAFRGVFHNDEWILYFDPAQFAGPPPEPDVMRQLVQDAVHEARHCEQWFRMARFLAGRSPELTASEIAKDMEIPEHIAARARRRPLTGAGAEVEEARAWYESVYGADRARRTEILLKMGAAAVAEKFHRPAYLAAKAERDAAKADLDIAAPERREAARQRFEAAQKAFRAAERDYLPAYREWRKWYDLYEQLPTEADADRTGKRVADALP